MMKKHFIAHFWLQVRTAFVTFFRAVWYEYYPALFALVFFTIILFLEWLFEYEQFYHIVFVNEASLSMTQIITILLQSAISVFKYPNDLTPVSLILIAFFQSATVLMWVRSRTFATKNSKSPLGALGIGLLGAGCVACASSLLGVLLSVFGAVVSVAMVQAIGDLLLIVAVILSLKAFIDIGFKMAGYVGR